MTIRGLRLGRVGEAHATAAPWRVPALLGTAALAVLLALVTLLALTQGSADIPAGTVLRVLVDSLPWVEVETSASDSWERILLQIRLPRVLAACLVGAALSLSGSAYQGIFRNPLAEPYLLGVAAGAGLAVAIAVVSPLPVDAYGLGWVPILAFIGGLSTVLIVYAVARSGGMLDGGSLILGGVALSAVWAGATSFLIINGSDTVSQPILSFLFGGFNTSSWEKVLVATPYILVGTLVIALHARALNVLQLDEEQAEHLGVDVSRTKLIVLAAASLVAATAVAVAGVIGFVGLIVPHAIRMLFGGDYRRTLAASLLGGALLMVSVDLLARTIIQPQEVPVGVLTAMLGGPFFLLLLRSRKVSL
ncbi:MAG: iron ABC transporter permease [Dehalococcoidia bacterium]|nr:iron ABC transporter permease [Dehalococcoidia bacterium]